MKKLRISRWEGRLEQFEDLIAEEGLLLVNIGPGPGPEPELSFSAAITPEQVKSFVFGYLLSEGLIQGKDDVREYHEYGEQLREIPGEVIHVDLRLRELPKDEVPWQRDYNIIWSECGGGSSSSGGGGWSSEGFGSSLRLEAREPHPLISGEELIQIPVKIAGEIEGFKRTGAYHYAFLFDPELNLKAKAKDIGRHNAVDKVIGEELLGEGRFAERLLFTTGRITADIVLKCLRAGIPLIASRGAALWRAVVLARRYNLGVVGFLRGRRFNIYSGEGWIEL